MGDFCWYKPWETNNDLFFYLIFISRQNWSAITDSRRVFPSSANFVAIISKRPLSAAPNNWTHECGATFPIYKLRHLYTAKRRYRTAHPCFSCFCFSLLDLRPQRRKKHLRSQFSTNVPFKTLKSKSHN